MSTTIRATNLAVATASLLTGGMFVMAYLAGVGETPFIAQSGTAFLAFSLLSIGVGSARAGLSGTRMLPRMTMARLTSRSFARNLADNLAAILSQETPELTADASITGRSSRRPGRIKERFTNTSSTPLKETIRHEGRTIEIEHHYKGAIAIHVTVANGMGAPIVEALTSTETDLVGQCLTDWKTAAFAEMLHTGATPEHLAANVAMRLPDDHHEAGCHALTKDETGLSCIVMGSGNRWLVHPDIGYLLLDSEVLEEVLKDRKEHQLLAAFDRNVDPIEDVPTIVGNPMAAKEISVAQKLVERYPDMTDASGTAIAPLVREHLPRLVRAHKEATATAMLTDRIDEEHLRRIGADFEEGLAVVTRAVLEGVEEQQRRSRDDLTVEIAFLKARHPDKSVLGAV